MLGGNSQNKSLQIGCLTIKSVRTRGSGIILDILYDPTPTLRKFFLSFVDFFCGIISQIESEKIPILGDQRASRRIN